MRNQKNLGGSRDLGAVGAGSLAVHEEVRGAYLLLYFGPQVVGHGAFLPRPFPVTALLSSSLRFGCKTPPFTTIVQGWKFRVFPYISASFSGNFRVLPYSLGNRRTRVASSRADSVCVGHE